MKIDSYSYNRNWIYILWKSMLMYLKADMKWKFSRNIKLPNIIKEEEKLNTQYIFKKWKWLNNYPVLKPLKSTAWFYRGNLQKLKP